MGNSRYLLAAALLALVLLSVQWVWSPVSNLNRSLKLMQTTAAGFSYDAVPAGSYLPALTDASLLAEVDRILADQPIQPVTSTLLSRVRAATAFASQDSEKIGAVLQELNGQAAQNQVLALTQGAVLEQAGSLIAETSDPATRQAQRGLAWKQAFGDIETALRIGTALQTVNRLEEATRHFERVVLAFPQYRESWYYLAVLYSQQEQPQDAVAMLQQGLLATETTGRIGSSNLYYRLARIQNYTPELNDPEAVRLAYDTALTRDDFGTQKGDEVDLNFQMGHLEYNAGNWAEALIKYEAAVNTDPATYYPQLMLAAALWQMDRAEEAIARLENAIRTDPTNKTAYQWLAELFHRSGQDEQARSVLQQILAIDPLDPDAQNAMTDLTLLPAYIPGL